MRRVAAKRVATVAVAALALLGAGCLGGCGGGEPASDSEPTGFAAVLAGVGGGGENGSLGVGWVDERAAAQLDPRTRAELERALGPNADTVVEQAPALRRRLGSIPVPRRRSSRWVVRTRSGSGSTASEPRVCGER